MSIEIVIQILSEETNVSDNCTYLVYLEWGSCPNLSFDQNGLGSSSWNCCKCSSACSANMRKHSLKSSQTVLNREDIALVNLTATGIAWRSW